MEGGLWEGLCDIECIRLSGNGRYSCIPRGMRMRPCCSDGLDIHGPHACTSRATRLQGPVAHHALSLASPPPLSQRCPSHDSHQVQQVIVIIIVLHATARFVSQRLAKMGGNGYVTIILTMRNLRRHVCCAVALLLVACGLPQGRPGSAQCPSASLKRSPAQGKPGCGFRHQRTSMLLPGQVPCFKRRKSRSLCGA